MDPTSAILIVLTIFIIYYVVSQNDSDDSGMTTRGKAFRKGVPIWQGSDVKNTVFTDYLADGIKSWYGCRTVGSICG